MKQNVLLITLDDVNYNSHDFLKKNREDLTPNLDALKKDAMLFWKPLNNRLPVWFLQFNQFFSEKMVRELRSHIAFWESRG